MNMTTPPATLPLARLSADYNPRRYFDRARHDELVASMRLRGMLQPILARPGAEPGDNYRIVAGGRRYRAALEAFGADGEVPVIIREMTDQEALEAAIDENDVRDDASETEQADAAVRVLAACRNDRAEAARRLGWSPSKLDRRLALAGLSETVKTALDERRIKVGHAELLAAVPTDKQDKALETVLKAGLDVGKTRELLMRVTQDLGHAAFDKTDCATCPFNSAMQRVLFDTHVDEGHCTNPECFQLKTEAALQAREEEAERDAAAAEAEMAEHDDGAEGDAGDDSGDDDTAPGEVSDQPVAERRTGPAAPRKSAPPAATTFKPADTGKAIITRTTDLREASWRTALARVLAGNAEYAHTAILAAAMSGTLSQIKADTLTARAGLLVDAAFPKLGYAEQIEKIRALSSAQAASVLSAIGAAYARDVFSFGRVADLARAFGVDLRDSWQVDQAFLERYTKDELKFIARECGLVAHMGERTFAKLLSGRKTDLVAGMLRARGFSWAGRLPGAMTLDGKYGPPLPTVTPPAVTPPPANVGAQPSPSATVSANSADPAAKIAA